MTSPLKRKKTEIRIEKPLIRGTKGILANFRNVAKENLPPEIWRDAVPGFSWINDNIPTEPHRRHFYPNATHPDSAASAYINPNWVTNDPRVVARHYGVSLSAVNSHVPYDSYLGQRWYTKDTLERGRFVRIRKGGRGRPILKFELIDLT
jgi:hypothetical protein